jgi:hypothetical protein
MQGELLEYFSQSLSLKSKIVFIYLESILNETHQLHAQPHRLLWCRVRRQGLEPVTPIGPASA